MKSVHFYITGGIALCFTLFVAAFSFRNPNVNGAFALAALALAYSVSFTALILVAVVVVLALARIGTGAAFATMRRHWLAFLNAALVVAARASFHVGNRWS